MLLFTYGSLQSPQVQLDTFGRVLSGVDDVMPGYTVDYLHVADTPADRAGDRVGFPILRPTGDPLDKVVGVAAWVSEDELESADEYEAERYLRVQVELASGRVAWVYIAL